MAVGGQEVDARLVHIEREDAQSLNGIEEHERAALVGDLRDPPDVVPVAGREADPAHGHDPRPLVAGFGQAFQIEPAADIGRHAPRFDAAAGQIHPRIDVRRKLVGERDDIVARSPIESFGNQADAARRVADERDLIRMGADHLRGRGPHRFDALHPIAPNRVADLHGLRQPFLKGIAAGRGNGDIAA